MIPTGNSPEDVRQRLVLLRVALIGAKRGDQAKFATKSGITTSEWNNLEKGKGIGIAVLKAQILRNRWGVSLDWIYCGDDRLISVDMREKLFKASDEEQAA